MLLSVLVFVSVASRPCNSFHCLGHSKNVCDDDDDMIRNVLKTSIANEPTRWLRALDRGGRSV